MDRSVLLLTLAVLLLAGGARAQTGRDDRLRDQVRRAQVLERAGELERAFSVLEAALEENPSDPAAVLGLERLARRLGRTEVALPIVRRGIESDPSASLLRQVELRLLAELGREGELREAGERWLAEAGGSSDAHRDYARALQRLGRPQEAERVLLGGREVLDDPAALAPELADLYVSRGRWSDAAAEWIALAEAHPAVAWDLVVYRLESLGTRAKRASVALLERSPPGGGEYGVMMLRAIAALHADRPELARREAEAALNYLEAANRRKLLVRFARRAARGKRPGLAAWAYRALLPDLPEGEGRLDLARRIVVQDLAAADTAAALNTLRDVLDRSAAGAASHRWASAWVVRVRAAQGDDRRAGQALERHLELYPDDRELPALALVVAEASMRDGDLERAGRVLERVGDPEGATGTAGRIAAARGYLALYEGRYDEARERLQSAAESLRDEERSEALRLLGFLRRASGVELSGVAAAHRARLQGRPLDAFERLQEVLQRSAGSQARPALLLWAGELALQAGAVARAKPVLLRVPERFPASGEAPVALMRLAEALAVRSTDRAQATGLLERLILDYPNSALTPIARRRLAELRAEVPRS